MRQSPLTYDIPRHRRKRGAKLYRIKYRYVRNGVGLWRTYWKKYETAKARDAAVRRLNICHGSLFGRPWMEFRSESDRVQNRL